MEIYEERCFAGTYPLSYHSNYLLSNLCIFYQNHICVIHLFSLKQSGCDDKVIFKNEFFKNIEIRLFRGKYSDKINNSICLNLSLQYNGDL